MGCIGTLSAAYNNNISEKQTAYAGYDHAIREPNAGITQRREIDIITVATRL
ncbi:hypothetical protein [Agrobacterium rosae]|uniref:hypothetical protein n=1 Tax=Agrobacterium rosae TaxID=1972867 RepID=UPI00135650E7|nr:hypothetical protein [Agrobacterium rosae]